MYTQCNVIVRGQTCALLYLLLTVQLLLFIFLFILLLVAYVRSLVSQLMMTVRCYHTHVVDSGL